MALRKLVPALLVAVGGLAACGGGGDLPPVEGIDPTLIQTEPDSMAPPAEGTQLLREVFDYRAGARDPFASLVSTGANLRPLPEDLRLLAVTYDASYPLRSVAVMRDTTVNRRYALRVNDRIGRMLVKEIRRTEVVFEVENFGVPEQVIVRMRRRDGSGGF